MKINPEQERELMLELWDPRRSEDLLNFVLFSYPWGKQGTPLEKWKGPRKWQANYLDDLSQHIKDNRLKMDLGLPPSVFQGATVSGRGPGKSALVSWLTHHNLTCNVGSTTIVTANTEPQLKSRTWAEMGKWHTLAINSHWFEKTALSMKPMPWFEEAVKKQLKIDTGYYYAQAQLWSEDNPDAFAGVHNPHGIVVIFDEASGIHESIWKVTEGFFTEPELHRYWHVFSNGRRPSGAFFECFHKNRAYWKLRQIDSRTVEGTDSALFERMIGQYGIDSDTVRVEVLGQFPRQGDRQFISRSVVREAMTRETIPDEFAPLVMGVDIARFGDDSSVIRWRQGRDGRSIPPRKFRNLDSVQMQQEIARAIDETNPDGVCIDAGNTGAAVIDGLKASGYKVHEVWFGAKASSDEWANKRTEMWGELRAWLPGGCLDNDIDLETDLTAPEYDYMGRGDKVMLESKESMKSRGFSSPDNGDALALTFARKFARRDLRAGRYASSGGYPATGVDDDVFTV